MNQDIALYIHWPYCLKKCPYCDFNSHVTRIIPQGDFAKAYLRDIDNFSHLLTDKTITSVYFGGGTPSLMEYTTVRSILEKLRNEYNLHENTEITLEANPTSVESRNFEQFAAAGVNRVSLGIQSLRESALRFLGREHSAKEAKDVLQIARDNFVDYNFDLIYARPKQMLADWQEELHEAIEFAGGHISVYQLVIEKGTKFYAMYNRGEFEIPNQDMAAEFFELTNQILYSHGLRRYEVSNHAKPGLESVHNLSYWRYNSYLGIGPGAHSRIIEQNKVLAFYGIYKPEKWLDGVHINKAVAGEATLSRQEILDELLLMGLRTTEGVNLSKFRYLFGQTYDEVLDINELTALIDEEMLEISGGQMRLTNKSLLLLNSVINRLQK